MNTTLALVPIIEKNITIPLEPIPIVPTATPTPKFFQNIPDIIGDIIFPFATNTPVPPTPVPPTATPTESVVPVTTTPTGAALSGTPEVRESATPTAMVAVSPTPTGEPQKPQNRNMTETFLWIALIVLVLVILRSNWDKIKAGFTKKEE